MAEPRKTPNTTPNGGRTAAPGESATRIGGKPAQPGRDRDLMRTGKSPAVQRYLEKLQNSESASRLGGESLAGELMREEDILEAIAAEQGMEKANLKEVEFTPELLREVPSDVAKRYGLVPVRATETDVWLALSDPHDVEALDDLARVLNKRTHGMVASADEIERIIQTYYDTNDYTELYNEMADNEEPTYDRKWEELNIGGEEATAANQPPVVRFVDLIFRQAVHERASDIHVEPSKYGVTIRFRIDGVLNEIPSPPARWQNAIISRLKVLAGMDLAEKRIPLDGRIRLNLGDKKLDLRVSSLPTIFGESIVMRILDQSQVMMGLADVGFLPRSIATFKKLIKSPNGVILMTGPTGSGKTTTLYAALGELNTPEEKLVTLEDPVEYQIPGINQIQINHEIGLDFARGLRSLLRQSPDVILVGEIRDLETAENAIRAALTGHLVFSTLHTNDAPSATTRLIDMGIKPYLVASSLQAAIAQRLVRRICGACKEAYRPPAEAIIEMGNDPDEFRDQDFFRGRGCERCSQGGYRGRTAIHEIMIMDTELRRRVIRSEPATRLKKVAVSHGMTTLRMDGWEKCLLGQTTLEEVMRITQND